MELRNIVKFLNAEIEESLSNLGDVNEKEIMKLDDPENNASFEMGWLKCLEYIRYELMRMENGKDKERQ